MHGRQGQHRDDDQAMHYGPRHRHQKTLRDSEIIAKTAAAAVRMIGLKRRTAASVIAVQHSMPRSQFLSIGSIKITKSQMIMPLSAITPSNATKLNGRCSSLTRLPLAPR